MNPLFRTRLVLGRVANLPVVWSHCLAGWWLGGGENYWKLPFLFLGLSALHTGGMFLNDAFDADSDRLRRPDRPIPAGKIPAEMVWRQGLWLLGLGILLLACCGKLAALAAVLLALTILIYDFAHKLFTASPWLLGACRFWVYVIAAAAGVDGLNGFAVFGGAALAVYTVGLGYATRRENARALIPRWPLLLLTAPIIMALLLNTGGYRHDALCISLGLALWLGRCVRAILLRGEPNTAWTASNLMAGMVIVDWLAVGPEIPHLASSITFPLLFLLVKIFQKLIPAK